jgi:hypothetical protein
MTGEIESTPPASGVRPDRRIHPRAELDAPVLIDAGHSWGKARCQNVSVGGLALQVERPLSAGTRVDLYFELPTGVAIETQAEVVRSDGDEIGLRFVGSGPNERAALSTYVRLPSHLKRDARTCAGHDS